MFSFSRYVVLVLLFPALLFTLTGCGETPAAETANNPSASQRNNACPDGQEVDKTITLTERAWSYYPSSFEVKQGDCVEVKMKVTDNGIGAGHGFAIEGFENSVFLNGVTKNNPKTTRFMVNKPPGEYQFYCATQCSTDKRHTNMNGTMIVKK
ncbi:MAG: hypothetical protein ABEK50_06060 [bacterium]